jgi:acetoacetyl-CoA synthetase
MLLQVKKDSMLHGDLREGDISFQYTTVRKLVQSLSRSQLLILGQTGWIMWGMVICALGANAKVVVYDGSPFVPDANVLLRLVSELK